MGNELMGNRIVFTKTKNQELSQVYPATDVFALGSLLKTSCIVDIEAMSMPLPGLPVLCTHHPNQHSIIGRSGVFVDMSKPGALAAALCNSARDRLAALGAEGRTYAVEHYELRRLADRYVAEYSWMVAALVEAAQGWVRTRFRWYLRSASQPFVQWGI